MQKEVTGVGGTAACNDVTFSFSCIYCDKETLALAPRDSDHFDILWTIEPGTRMQMLLPSSRVWCDVLVFAQLNDGLWLIKRRDQDLEAEPSCYHLRHYQLNIIKPCVPFPLNSSWKGAIFNASLPSKGDIVCKICSGWSSTLNCTVNWGSVEFG